MFSANTSTHSNTSFDQVSAMPQAYELPKMWLPVKPRRGSVNIRVEFNPEIGIPEKELLKRVYRNYLYVFNLPNSSLMITIGLIV